MASCGVMYIPSFMNIGAGIQAKIWESVMLVLLKGGIYDVHRWDGLMWHNVHIKFHEDGFSYSKFNREGDTNADTHTHRQESELINLFLYFQNKESRLKNNIALMYVII
jgi:hypothetical protein